MVSNWRGVVSIAGEARRPARLRLGSEEEKWEGEERERKPEEERSVSGGVLCSPSSGRGEERRWGVRAATHVAGVSSDMSAAARARATGKRGADAGSRGGRGVRGRGGVRSARAQRGAASHGVGEHGDTPSCSHAVLRLQEGDGGFTKRPLASYFPSPFLFLLIPFENQ